MAKKEKKKKEKSTKKETSLATVRFAKKNTLFFGIGLILVIAGFVLLASGDIVVAPILLIVGYLVFFPLGILLK
ncbi:MAG: hypothetical protein JSU64_02305 [candidate division WOR-3 bacterium]|nr:MAG: hypothetical protein JSU64_02305 [candidate division WOR-3 bacterium]